MQSRPKVFVGELFGGFGARPVRNTAVPTKLTLLREDYYRFICFELHGLVLVGIVVVAAGTCAFEFLPPTKHSSLLGFVLAQQPLQIVGVAWVLLFIVAKSVVG
jgi:hypothetical protein